jgi:ABC-type antimicrobial peptide transport system permease subunit
VSGCRWRHSWWAYWWALLGVAIVYVVSSIVKWTVVISYATIPLWLGLAIAVSVAASLYPSIKAAHLQPLETLRLS